LQIENITERERILFQHKLRLRYDTAPILMQNLLEALRALLASHSRVDPEPARVRFIGFGDSYLELELYAYVNTRDWSEYLEISEGLHLRILEIIGQEGAELAYPTRTVNMEGVAPEKKQTV
jgi:MscS family membrane protein